MQAKGSEAWERYVLNSHKPPATNSTVSDFRLAAEWCGYIQEISMSLKECQQQLAAISHADSTPPAEAGQAHAAFEDALAATSQDPVGDGSYALIAERDGFSDLVVIGPVEIAFSQTAEIPVGRIGLDPPGKLAHAWRKPTLAEIAAEPDLHVRAWALLLNDVEGDTPEAIALLESVREEGWFGEIAYHAGMVKPGEPIDRILNPKRKPRPRKRPASWPSLLDANWEAGATGPAAATSPATEVVHDTK